MNRTIVRKKLNAPCSCGSGKKYKNCCFKKDVERVTKFMKAQIKKRPQEAFEKKRGIWIPT